MDTTELDNVQALFERVRPDPAGFAQRLLMQVMASWGDIRMPDPTTFYADVEQDDGLVDRTVVTQVQPSPMYDGLADTNILVSAALGACECWGLVADCEVCGGAGTPGWTLPDPDLFAELVGPAVARMSAAAGDGAESGRSGNNHRSSQGVDR